MGVDHAIAQSSFRCFSFLPQKNLLLWKHQYNYAKAIYVSGARGRMGIQILCKIGTARGTMGISLFHVKLRVV